MPSWAKSLAQNQKEVSKCTTKDKPKEKFDGVLLKKSTVTTTTASTIWQPLKAVTGGAPQSRKAVISVSEQVQQFEQVQEDLPVASGPMSIDPPHRVEAEILQTKSLHIVSSPRELKPVDEVDEEESKRVVKKRRTSSDLPEEVRIVAHIPQAESRNILSLVLSGPLHHKRIRMATSGTTSMRKTLTTLSWSASTSTKSSHTSKW